MEKTLFFVIATSILLTSLPIQKASALSCYEGGAGIYTLSVCPAGSTFCQTVTTSVLGMSTTAKACTSSCISGTIATVTTSCCSTNNCNGENTARNSSTSLFTSGIFLSFLIISAFIFKNH
ncbi:unnamed protein product [Brachionus calyciflorus]|uniref:Snake toxin/toxin-like domain-containing protein n=1 Tax=Brachionus calyciflorus TaxID=104777 RepID=A0A814MY11_9BILA|nr:unnamed protein product [Brachionus calyciflorus]